jgi:hypothetical protein
VQPTHKTQVLGEIDMSGIPNSIVLKRDYSGVRIADDALSYTDTLDESVGGLVDKSDYGHCMYGANWDSDYMMTKFIEFIVEYSNLGYYQLKNKCKAIVETQEPLRVTIKSYGSVRFDDGTSHYEMWQGNIHIDPVLAQAILDSYN